MKLNLLALCLSISLTNTNAYAESAQNCLTLTKQLKKEESLEAKLVSRLTDKTNRFDRQLAKSLKSASMEAKELLPLLQKALNAKSKLDAIEIESRALIKDINWVYSQKLELSNTITQLETVIAGLCDDSGIFGSCEENSESLRLARIEYDKFTIEENLLDEKQRLIMDKQTELLELYINTLDAYKIKRHTFGNTEDINNAQQAAAKYGRMDAEIQALIAQITNFQIASGEARDALSSFANKKLIILDEIKSCQLDGFNISEFNEEVQKHTG